MKRDLFYIFDKVTFKRQELGEILTGFNMSLVLDGTKDSTKIEVWSYSRTNIEPNTICWHEKTGTWWIVDKDNIERTLNENGTYVYIHRINLLGAIELFNARDLTDCGFNQKRYTVQQFLNRLFDLSNFEFKGQHLVLNALVGSNFLLQKVDFVKTYENYTLLSAIRDLLDSYNMSAKLSFYTYEQDEETYLYSAIVDIVSKTGNQTLTTHNVGDFDDIREKITMSKESFGTCVVSNAENVISTVAKTFPSTGCAKVSGTEYTITPDNAVIRLPSNVYKVNWMKIATTIAPFYLNVERGTDNLKIVDKKLIKCNPYSIASIEISFRKIKEEIYNAVGTSITSAEYEEIEEALDNAKESIYSQVKAASTITLYNGNELNPISGDIMKGEGVPLLTKVYYTSKSAVTPPNPTFKPLIICDEETKNTLPIKYYGIQYKRGSNIISGFDCFKAVTGASQSLTFNLENSDLRVQAPNSGNQSWYYEYFYVETDTGNHIKVSLRTDNAAIYTTPFYTVHFPEEKNGNGATQFIINYVPMSDIKVKVDNTQDKKDTHLYNQNGKLTDNFALSKLINSYAKEISSDTITRYAWYYDFQDVPKVGSFVYDGNTTYVINNVSCTFTQNEKDNVDFGYEIECEITMSKHVAVKSLMVNPNTNIRDYGIPQNFNVKRKQLYRDYYELSYSVDADNDNNYFIDPSVPFNIGRSANEQINLVAVIRCDYAEPIGGDDDETLPSYEWYYQLETTTYEMSKMIYVVCDFNDNNIIGYANQNVYSGFKIERVFSGTYDDLNTPISYVDSKGEIESIYIKFCNNAQLTSIYQTYQDNQVGGDSYDGSLYNYSCFIPAEIYEWLADYTMMISEPTYNKDAIEVPVFEYCCQVNDTEEVLIGDNILTQHDDCLYFYHYIVGNNLTPDNVYDNSQMILPTEQHPYRYRLNDSAVITYDNKQLKVNIYNYTSYGRDTNTWNDYLGLNITTNKDLAIFRHAYSLQTGEETVELMFIAKKIPASAVSQNGKTLTLKINHWKLN